jgi:hypothetical protein
LAKAKTMMGVVDASTIVSPLWAENSSQFSVWLAISKTCLIITRFPLLFPT